jgi:hypothetical protein
LEWVLIPNKRIIKFFLLGFKILTVLLIIFLRLRFIGSDIVKLVDKSVSGISLRNVLIDKFKGFGLVVFGIRVDGIVFEVIFRIRC